MNHVKFLTLTFLCLIAGTVSAQSPSSAIIPQDTLVILLEGSNQVHLIYENGKKLQKYERADSLKNLFIDDFKKALNAGMLPEDTRIVHYLVGANGKRRLKAETDSAEQVFNLAEEKRRMLLDLPKYHYIIYDLDKNVELHIYLENNQALDLVAIAKLDDALNKMEKKKFTFHSVYAMRMQNGNIVQTDITRGKARLEIITVPYAGLALIGNNLSPNLTIDIAFRFYNKYGINKGQIGYRPENFIISSFHGDSIRNLDLGSFQTFYYRVPAPRNKDVTYGVSVGFLGWDTEGAPPFLQKGTTKLGLLGSYKYLNYSVETIWNRKEEKGYIMGTVSVPLLPF
jgi:hypothetical protein